MVLRPYFYICFFGLFVIAALFDIIVVEWVAENRSELFISAARTVTDLGEGNEYFGLAALVLFLGLANSATNQSPLKTDAKGLRDYGWLCLKVMIVTGLAILALKFGFGRSRPDLWIENSILSFIPISLESTRDFKSFPSGHTQTAFTIAVLLSLVLPKKFHAWLFVLAGLVGLSRLVLLEHWLTDILAGAFVGTILPLLIIRRTWGGGIGPRLETRT